jgi:hypothetical protein
MDLPRDIEIARVKFAQSENFRRSAQRMRQLGGSTPPTPFLRETRKTTLLSGNRVCQSSPIGRDAPRKHGGKSKLTPVSGKLRSGSCGEGTKPLDVVTTWRKTECALASRLLLILH